MPKFYVRSGRLRRVIDRRAAAVAARCAVEDHVQNSEIDPNKANDQLGFMTFVSERGFRGRDLVTVAFETHSLIPRILPGDSE